MNRKTYKGFFYNVIRIKMSDQKTRRIKMKEMHEHRDEFIKLFWNTTKDEQAVSQYDWLVANSIFLQEIYEFIKSLDKSKSE